MNKPKLIKRGAIPSQASIESTIQAGGASLNKTRQNAMTVVKDWLNTRQQTTRQNAREAFSRLFAQSSETCTGC